MKLDEKFDGICVEFTQVQKRYDEMVEAFRTFCSKKHELAALLQPHDPDDDGQGDASTGPEPYPSEEEKAKILDAIRTADTADLAEMLRETQPDLGALNDETRMVFIARTALDEAAKRLEARKESK